MFALYMRYLFHLHHAIPLKTLLRDDLIAAKSGTSSYRQQRKTIGVGWHTLPPASYRTTDPCESPTDDYYSCLHTIE